jgi:chorismate mutase-like protein
MAMSGVSISTARQKTAMFSVPYLRDGKTPIALCSNQARFQTLAQIDQADVRVVVNPGGTNESFARANLQHAQLVVFPDNNRIFEQIVEGKADVMMTDAIEARLQQQLKPTLCALHPEAPFNLSEKAYLLPQDAAWKTVVDHWLQKNIHDGVVTKLMDKWLAHPWSQANAANISVDALRDLMAQRLSMMEDVARHKWNQQTAIEDLPREQKIIASLQEQALALGIPAAWAEQFFRAQIEAAKQIQSEHFAQWRAKQQTKFEIVPNLDTVIRPRLDQLTTQILRELAMTWPALVDPHERTRIAQAMRKLSTTRLSDEALQIAIKPLIDGSAF